MNNPSAARIPAGALLREVTRMYARAQRVVADCCRTTSTQCHLLVELDRAGTPLSLTDLGARLCLEKSWVSRAVDTMVGRGLVTKEPNPADARSWLVTLTPAGRDTVSALNESLDTHAERLLATLGPDERAGVAHSLQRLLDALRTDPSATCCLPAPARRETTPCC
ncbi:MAG: MarR family winged helix-turn-helix transcriptional regulator [Gammaproteobacteria bacterium]